MSSNSKLHENATFIGSGWEGEGKQTKNGKRKTSVLSGSPNGSDNKYMFSLQINYFRFFFAKLLDMLKVLRPAFVVEGE